MNLARITGALPLSWLKAISRAQWRHPLLKRAFNFAANRFRNQDATIQRGAGKGLRFNTGRSNAGYLLGTTEPMVQMAFTQLVQPEMVVYDVGANVGFLTVIAARLVGPGGRVIAFEPLPENFEHIRHNASLNQMAQIIVRSEAVSDTDGTAQFQVSAEPTWGNLVDAGKQVRLQQGTIEVKVSCLDSLLASEELPSPDLIKIDVEGAEAKVLLGAADTLRRLRPLLLIELHGTNQAIAKLLDEYAYVGFVLGDTRAVADSAWDAYVAAAPRDEKERVAAAQALTRVTTNLEI